MKVRWQNTMTPRRFHAAAFRSLLRPNLGLLMLRRA